MPIPTGLKLLRNENVLVVHWPNGRTSRLAGRRLRCECRCAGCVDEHTGIRILDVDAVPQDLKVTHAAMAGNYALKLTFSDDHDTGLFTWEHLFSLDHSSEG
ncbi:MAG: DUF971 domain-containing protein [Planctomycetota bacterium]